MIPGIKPYHLLYPAFPCDSPVLRSEDIAKNRFPVGIANYGSDGFRYLNLEKPQVEEQIAIPLEVLEGLYRQVEFSTLSELKLFLRRHHPGLEQRIKTRLDERLRRMTGTGYFPK